MRNASDRFEYSNAKLRAYMKHGHSEEKINQAMDEVKKAEADYNARLSDLKDAVTQQGDAMEARSKRNIGIGAAVGLPGLAGISYGRESWMDSDGN